MNIKALLKQIRKAMRKDAELAWAWHCNVAVATIDEGLNYAAANRAAARFMQAAFDVDTSERAECGNAVRREE